MPGPWLTLTALGAVMGVIVEAVSGESQSYTIEKVKVVEGRNKLDCAAKRTQGEEGYCQLTYCPPGQTCIYKLTDKDNSDVSREALLKNKLQQCEVSNDTLHQQAARLSALATELGAQNITNHRQISALREQNTTNHREIAELREQETQIRGQARQDNATHQQMIETQRQELLTLRQVNETNHARIAELTEQNNTNVAVIGGLRDSVASVNKSLNSCRAASQQRCFKDMVTSIETIHQDASQNYYSIVQEDGVLYRVTKSSPTVISFYPNGTTLSEVTLTGATSKGVTLALTPSKFLITTIGDHELWWMDRDGSNSQKVQMFGNRAQVYYHEGMVYITSREKKLYLFDANLNPRGIYSTWGATPHGFCVLPGGDWAVAAREADKLFFSAPDGTLRSELSLSGAGPYGLLCSPCGEVLVAGYTDQKLYLITDRTVVTELRTLPHSNPTALLVHGGYVYTTYYGGQITRHK